MSPRRQQALDGLEQAETHLSVQGAAFNSGEGFELGQNVTLRIKGHVTLVGTEALEKEGVRRVVKVKADLIELEQ